MKIINFWIFFYFPKQLKWKLSDNIIEYYGHLIVLCVCIYVCVYCTHTTDNSRHDAKLSEVGSVLNIFTVGCSRNNFYKYTHTRKWKFMRTHSKSHIYTIKVWMVGRLLSFIFYFLVYVIIPYLFVYTYELCVIFFFSHFSQMICTHKKKVQYQCTTTITQNKFNLRIYWRCTTTWLYSWLCYVLFFLLTLHIQFLLHLFIHLTKAHHNTL